MPSSRLVLLPYNLGSHAARVLANQLTVELGNKVRRVRPNGNYRPTPRSLIVNYGSSQWPVWTPLSRVWLNKPPTVAVASNKLSAFRRFTQENVACPEWTQDGTVANTWLTSGNVVVCRNLLNSHGGRGIILVQSPEDELPRVPLYVKYKKKRKEFRVHVFNGQVIDVQEKRKQKDFDGEVDSFIRNHDNGWVFCRDNVVKPDNIDDLTVRACRSLGLDFGAVDIIWNSLENKCYVLEVNTAPGLEGTTLTNYTNAILQWMRNQ